MAHVADLCVRAGTVDELQNGALLVVDIGFAERARSSAWALDDADVQVGTFAQLVTAVVRIVEKAGPPLNLIIEAPLSVAFSAAGNPTPRKPEVAEKNKRRSWYCGPGASVLIAATYLMRAVADASLAREIRLFEGFVSFKPKGTRSDHAGDVRRLRSVARGRDDVRGEVLAIQRLRRTDDDQLQSALAVAGMDFGVPAVVFVDRP
jgi:hypothetical protein